MSTDHCLIGLRPARLRSAIEPQALADAIGIDVRSYYRYEQGKRLITFDKACVLADMLGISTDDLRRDTSDSTMIAAALGEWTADDA